MTGDALGHGIGGASGRPVLLEQIMPRCCSWTPQRNLLLQLRKNEG